MARVELLCTVDKIVTSNLQPVSGGSVLVKTRSTGTPVTVYAAETGGTTVSNPLITDANGRVNGWVDEGSLVLTISGSGITTYNQPYEAVRGDGVTNIAAGAVTLAALASAVSDLLIKPGTIVMTARSSADTGYLLCQGQAVSRTTYSGLFALIGTTFGVGDGSTTFNVPDLRGRVPMGPDASAGRVTANNVLGNSSGLATHTLITSELASHTHTGGSHTHTGGAHTHADTFAVVSGGAHTHGFVGQHPSSSGWTDGPLTSPGNTFAFVPVAAGSIGSATGTASAGTHTHTLTGGVSSGGAVATAAGGVVDTTATGSGGAHNNLQPYTVVQFQIKT